MENTRRGRGLSKLTWTEAVKRVLKDWNVSREGNITEAKLFTGNSWGA
jgi:hypothetical protein